MFGLFKKKKKVSLLPGKPDFIIVGAQKAGTSSLYEALCSHPEIEAAQNKEIHFFDFNYENGKEWYQEQLQRAQGKKCGEASPFYIYHPKVAERIAEMYPKVKLIFLFRDPAARAVSHFRMNVADGTENLSPLQAMVAEENRVLEAMKKGESWDTPDSAFQHFTYKSRGHYEEQWLRFSKHFSRSQMFALRLEDLVSDTETCLNALAKFIGVKSHNWGEFPRLNSTEDSGQYEGYAQRYLEVYFEPHYAKMKTIIPLAVGSWETTMLPESSEDETDLATDELEVMEEHEKTESSEK
ncbi:MAG: sulfotransferase [Cryomorphaceae bacterium]|nr:sulfotransferase [Cryomorphaceae bacterium]